MTDFSSYLHDLQTVVGNILQRFRLKEGQRSQPLYRYIGFDTFRSMVTIVQGENGNMDNDREKRRTDRCIDLRVYDAETMNDPLEGRFLIEYAKENLRLLRPSTRCFSDLFKRGGDYHPLGARLIFIASFSRREDDLDLWRNYCKGHGVSFGFIPGSNADYYRVDYGKEIAESLLAELSWAIKPITDSRNQELCARAIDILRPVLYLVKADGHRSDEEVRLIEKRDGSSNDIRLHEEMNDPQKNARLYVTKKEFFFHVPNEWGEVLIGPLAKTLEYSQGKDAFLKEVKFRLAQNGITDIQVVQSRHDLRY